MKFIRIMDQIFSIDQIAYVNGGDTSGSIEILLKDGERIFVTVVHKSRLNEEEKELMRDTLERIWEELSLE